MRKVLSIGFCSLLVLSSCGTSTGTGAYVGGQFGHVIGSAVGGLTGGWRGSQVGSIIGTVGGAAAGAAIGAAVDNAQQKKYETGRVMVKHPRQQQRDESGFDEQGRGDDRIDFDGSTDTSYDTSSGYARSSETLQIRNARVVDANGDNVLMRKEECQVSFEILNHSNKTAINVQPKVMEISGNKHVRISPNLNIESIRPGEGVRYTATILADGRLKDGYVKIMIGVAQNGRDVTSQSEELIVPTRKKKR